MLLIVIGLAPYRPGNRVTGGMGACQKIRRACAKSGQPCVLCFSPDRTRVPPFVSFVHRLRHVCACGLAKHNTLVCFFRKKASHSRNSPVDTVFATTFDWRRSWRSAKGCTNRCANRTVPFFFSEIHTWTAGWIGRYHTHKNMKWSADQHNTEILAHFGSLREPCSL